MKPRRYVRTWNFVLVDEAALKDALRKAKASLLRLTTYSTFTWRWDGSGDPDPAMGEP